MKPPKQYTFRHPARVAMRELEEGDHPFDYEGRPLSFLPGDYLVLTPFQKFVLGRTLAETLYVETEDDDGNRNDDRSGG